MRHLLASSTVAGLLFLLPAGGANAQDNRNTSWGWGAAGGGGIVLSFIAAAAGAAGGSSIVLWKLSKLASKGKRDDKAMELALTQLNSSVKVLEEKSTKPEEIFQESSLINLASKMDTVSTNLETIKSDFTELSGNVINKIDNLSKDSKALNDLVLKSLEQNKPLQASTAEEEPESKRQKSNSNEDKQWEIMEGLCRKFYENDEKNQKIQSISPLDCLQLITISNNVNCYNCLSAIKKLLPDSLEILPEADKSAKDHKKFTNISQLFKLLWKLGTDVQEKMRPEGARTSDAVKDTFTEKQYAPQGGKTAIVKYKNETKEMHEHLKIGGGGEGASENSCLRIHFLWVPESKKFVIGHCGKHL